MEAWRFWSLQDAAVFNIALATVALALSCSLLGIFVLYRRLSLLGDTVAHALMPGVMLGFMLFTERNDLAMILGAFLSALIGANLIFLLKRKAGLSVEASMGIVLVSFFAAGTALLSLIERSNLQSKGIVKDFLLGKAAAVSSSDTVMLLTVSLLVVLVIAFCFRSLVADTFDSSFSRAAGLSGNWIDSLMLMLLSLVVVVGVKVVGIVMIASLLVIPAATASLLSRRFSLSIAIAFVIILISGFLGAWVSYNVARIPTGPAMVVFAAFFFFLAFLLSPRRGLLPQFIRFRAREVKMRLENNLKSIYQFMERSERLHRSVPLRNLAAYRNLTVDQVKRECVLLKRRGQLLFNDDASSVFLNDRGLQEAQRIVRNHRLWELYLSSVKGQALSEVHVEADEIEHHLDVATIVDLEKQLGRPKLDPHGRSIPTLGDFGKLK